MVVDLGGREEERVSRANRPSVYLSVALVQWSEGFLAFLAE